MKERINKIERQASKQRRRNFPELPLFVNFIDQEEGYLLPEVVYTALQVQPKLQPERFKYYVKPAIELLRIPEEEGYILKPDDPLIMKVEIAKDINLPQQEQRYKYGDYLYLVGLPEQMPFYIFYD
jgi:hypothetical protein